MWQCACGSTGYATDTTFKTTSWIICSTLWTSRLASVKLNVWVNQTVTSSQVVISLCNSANTYQDHDISSNLWKKAWTHSSFGRDAHKVWHSNKLSPRLLRPSYLPTWYTFASPKWIVISIRHWDYPMIELLWVSHQHARGTFSASSNANNYCGSNTLSLNSIRN